MFQGVFLLGPAFTEVKRSLIEAIDLWPISEKVPHKEPGSNDIAPCDSATLQKHMSGNFEFFARLAQRHPVLRSPSSQPFGIEYWYFQHCERSASIFNDVISQLQGSISKHGKGKSSIDDFSDSAKPFKQRLSQWLTLMVTTRTVAALPPFPLY